MRRAAFSMTIDPDGAMHDWVDLPPGWSLLKIPTQELVHLVGVRAYQELLVDVCARERPDVLVTHPPYDHLSIEAADRIRDVGTRVVGYAFDDEIFAAGYAPATRDAIARVYDRYVTTREVPWATAPLPALDIVAPLHDVVLVGRAYATRIALVEALRRAGVNVVSRGLGWPEGFVSRREMFALYARARIVLTTADWEHHAIPMVKHRLVDTAMLGAFQIAQDAPDLRRYFPADEVPSFRHTGELVDLVRRLLPDETGRRQRAAAARRRALAEHTWTRRWSQLLDGVALAPEHDPPPLDERSRLLDHGLLALAGRAETDARFAAAASLFLEQLAREPRDPFAAAGFGRCLRDLGETEAALPWLERAATAPATPCAAAIDAALPSFGVGTGLGRLGLLPPATEPIVFLVAGLLELGRVDDAAHTLDAVEDPVLRRAVARTLVLGDDPSFAPVRERLSRWRAEDQSR